MKPTGTNRTPKTLATPESLFPIHNYAFLLEFAYKKNLPYFFLLTCSPFPELAMPTLKTNKRGHFDYDILEEWQAGIVLTGAEVKAAKLGQVSLQGAYVTIRDGEAWLIGCRISPYRYAPSATYDPSHDRKLLLRKAEIKRLIGTLHTQGLTLIPLSVYSATGLVKVKLGLGRGKKKYDKRASIKKREVDRRISHAMKPR